MVMDVRQGRNEGEKDTRATETDVGREREREKGRVERERVVWGPVRVLLLGLLKGSGSDSLFSSTLQAPFAFVR